MALGVLVATWPASFQARCGGSLGLQRVAVESLESRGAGGGLGGIGGLAGLGGLGGAAGVTKQPPGVYAMYAIVVSMFKSIRSTKKNTT